MTTGGWIGLIVGMSILMVIVGAILGFFLARKYFTKQLKENPPITEKMVRAMFLQMGRKASESQIKAVMRQMQNADNK